MVDLGCSWMAPRYMNEIPCGLTAHFHGLSCDNCNISCDHIACLCPGCNLQEAADRAKMMLSWDVLNGVSEMLGSFQGRNSTPDREWTSNNLWCNYYLLQISRRSWSGHPLAKETLCAAMAIQPKLSVTVPHEVQSCEILDQVLQD